MAGPPFCSALTIVTISAKDGTGCDELFAMLKPYGNEGPHYFDDDAFTDMPEKELVAELVREKALLFLREEVPHGIAVVVERFKERPDKDLIDIDVDIYCERKSHKGMIITASQIPASSAVRYRASPRGP